MDAVANIDITFRLGQAIGGTEQLVQIALELEEKSFEKQLRPLIEEVLQLLESMCGRLRAFLRLPDEAQTPEAMEGLLVIAGLVATRLEELHAKAAEIEASVKIPDWLVEGLNKQRQFAEELRDIEETLALGQSDTFRYEISEAKKGAVG